MELNNVKIAICLSGVPRFERFTSWIKKIIQKHETKIFLSYWQPHDDFLIHSNTPSIRTPYELDINEYIFPEAETFYRTFSWDMYKPEFEEKLKQCPPESLWARRDLGVASMFFMIKQAQEMCECYKEQNNYDFDIVIRSRMDVFFKQGKFDYDFSRFDVKNAIYIPDYNLAPINDHFAIMNYENSKIYSRVYDNFVPLVLAATHWPEQMLIKQLNGIKLIEIDFVGITRFVGGPQD